MKKRPGKRLPGCVTTVLKGERYFTTVIGSGVPFQTSSSFGPIESAGTHRNV